MFNFYIYNKMNNTISEMLDSRQSHRKT